MKGARDVELCSKKVRIPGKSVRKWTERTGKSNKTTQGIIGNREIEGSTV